MSTLFQELTAKLKSFQESWTLWWTVLGSTLLYLLGYLVTRFQLTLFGVPTNLDVVNERYFYAGCRFFVYLFSSLSNLLIILLPMALLMFACHFWPGTPRWDRFQGAAAGRLSGFELRVIAIVFCILMIQFLMRQCFAYNNLLLAEELPDLRWLNTLLLDESSPDFFFSILLGTCLVSLALLLASRARPAMSYSERGAEVLLVVPVICQWLLLPVNYSYLIAHKTLPRVKYIWQRNNRSTSRMAGLGK